MFDVSSIAPRTSLDMLVAFSDLTLFAQWAGRVTPSEIFTLMDEMAEMVGEKVESSGGRVVKFIGDAALIVFPAEQAGPGILALREMQQAMEQWLGGKGLDCRLRLKVHFGPVVCGPFGTKDDKRFDVFGDTVNTTFRLVSFGFTISPQAFRCLDDAGRKLFKKHTPPIRYIPVEESHRD
jgi:adenylate cyclase